MGARALAVLTVVGGILVLVGPVSAAMVYVSSQSVSSENDAITRIKDILEADFGHTVTIGPPPSAFTPANVDLTGLRCGVSERRLWLVWRHRAVGRTADARRLCAKRRWPGHG